mgnify:CR=1 FL=1
MQSDNNQNNGSGSQWNRRKFLKSVPLALGAPFVLTRTSRGADAYKKGQQPDDKPISAEEVLKAVPEPVIPNRQDLKEMYDRCWVLGLESSELAIPGSGFVDWYIDAAFDNRIFQWDTCFSLAWAKYSQGSLPNMKSLDNFYRKQHEDGAISGVIRKESGEDDQPKDSPWFTRNNLFSWIEYEYYRTTGDASRFERVVPILADYARWVQRNRRHDNGHLFWSGWSSGMDNSPRSRADKFYPPYSWVDYDANEALAAWYLAKMAEVIGDRKTADEFYNYHAELKSLVNRDMWSEEDRFYWDLDKDGSFMKVKTIASFWPMWGRITEQNHVDGLMYHLNDSSSFDRPHRVPTTAADEEAYAYAGRYWRGSIWAPTNHMVTKGLMSQNQLKLARDIVLNHLNNMAAVFSSTNTVWENYSPEFSKAGEPAKSDFVGWSAVGPIAQLIENYIGIIPDVPDNKIRWNLLTTEKVGIRNLEFGQNNKVELVADERRYYTDPITISSNTQKAFTLELFDGENTYTRQIARGSSEFTLGEESDN